MRVIWIASLAAGLLVSACSDASKVNTPIVGRASWFAFVGGEDIRDACKPGTPARYRFVYNAVYDIQVRTYELTRTSAGAEFHVRIPPAGIAVVEFRAGAADVWNARREMTSTLDVSAYLAIARQLEADGFGAPTMTSQNLPSWDHYWVVSACADGKFHINGWRNGSPGFAALRFPALLFAQDKTEIPVNPISSNPYGDHLTRMRQGTADLNFDIQLAPDGLRQQMRLF